MMVKDLQLSEKPDKTMSMHPKKFLMWLFIVSIIMLYAALTSAYIVKKGDGEWLVFEIPEVFWVSTGILVLSSITMQWAYYAARRNNISSLKLALGSTTGLGILFLFGQLMGWSSLVQQDVYFVGNPAGSFTYVLTGLHGLHLVSGIIFLIIVLFSAFKYKIHSRSLIKIEMCKTYWHFLDVLWIYLFVFLLINQ